MKYIKGWLNHCTILLSLEGRFYSAVIFVGAVILLDDQNSEPRGSLCSVCGSNLRFRSIISVLMRKLFDDHKVLSQCHDPTISVLA